MDIPRYWRLREQRYHLTGTKCLSCGELSFPPRKVCPKCQSREMEAYSFNKKGTVYSYTTIYQAAEQFEQNVPYSVAIIELDKGVKVTAQLTDIRGDKVEIGMPVEMVIRKIYEEGSKGPIHYGFKFRPLFRSKEHNLAN